MLRVGKEHLFFPSCGCIKAIVFHSRSHFGLLPTSLPRANELLCLPCETFVAMRIPFEASPQCLFRNTLIRFSVIGGFSGLPYCSAIVICSIDLPRDMTRSQSAARRCAAAAPRDCADPRLVAGARGHWWLIGSQHVSVLGFPGLGGAGDVGAPGAAALGAHRHRCCSPGDAVAVAVSPAATRLCEGFPW